MRIKNYSIRIKAGGYDSAWYLSDLLPVGNLFTHFKGGITQLPVEDRTTLLNTIPDLMLLIAYNSACLIGLAYGTAILRRFTYS